jgi:hypothetical protein
MISFVENNLIFIVFYCSLQLKLGFQFIFFDKINLLVCLIYFWVSVIFAICFYLWKYSESKITNEGVLNGKKYHMSSFLEETMSSGFKNVAFGFIHAFFLGFYELQIGLLISAKLLLIYSNLRHKDSYHHSIYSYGSVFYYLSGVVYDILLLIVYSN